MYFSKYMSENCLFRISANTVQKGGCKNIHWSIEVIYVDVYGLYMSKYLI